MNQSALIGGALLAGFALFIASRDRLTTYGRILWGAKPDSHSSTDESSSGSVANNIAGNVFGDWAKDLGESMDELGRTIDGWTGSI